MTAVLSLALLALCTIHAVAQPYLAETHPKYLVSQYVYRDLVGAFEDGRTPPNLRVLSREAGSRLRVAWYQPQSRVVTLEERAYDLCSSLGADSLDALAWVLAHELAHCYKDHGWVADFGNAMASANAVPGALRDPASMEALKAAESEADYHGGFFAQVAGYAAAHVAPKVLQRIYQEYQLEAFSAGYPTLQERQHIARQAAQQLHSLLPVFEAGQALLLAKRYEEAGRCFDMIGRTFPSREILNNAGVARTLEAVELLGVSKAGWAYPLEFDADTRLRQQPKADQGLLAADVARSRELLRQAREWFQRARSRDPNYPSAFANLAVVADLQGEYQEAVYLAGRGARIARERGDQVSLAHALIIRGIARIHVDPRQVPTARRDLEQASAAAPSLSRLNLARLEGRPGHAETAARTPPTGPERIGGLAAAQYETMIDAATTVTAVPLVDHTQPPLDIYMHEADAWTAIVVEAPYGAFSFLRALPAYRASSAGGIVIGDDTSRLRELYGPPTYRVSSRQGTYHVYEPARIAFCLGVDHSVHHWMVYHLEK
jgi:tetratricopeptide (TPR) repeat protein